MRRKGSFVADINPFLLDVALMRAHSIDLSRVQHRAALLLRQVEMAPLAIPDGWRLAGEHLPRARQSFGFASDPPPAARRRLAEFGLSPDEERRVEAWVKRWTGRDLPVETCDIGAVRDGLDAGRGGWGGRDLNQVYWASGWIENHSVRDYAKALRVGFGAIRTEVEDELAALDIADADTPRKENFLRAVISICEAGKLLGRRYAELAVSMAERAADVQRRNELRCMARVCAKVTERGAETFFEATQALWLAHILTCGEDGINANSIGRLDQILFPYYAADRQAGRLSRDEALEIMEELGCKLYLEYDVQAIVLGGLDAQGRHAANELTDIILDATDNLEFVRDVSMRLDRNSPAPLLERCAALIVKGGGIPFIFNDDCFVKALSDRGIALEHARDYAPIGCIELTVPGKANPHAVSGWINSTKCLELALFGGQNPATGTALGAATPPLAEMASFGELWDAYRRQVEFFARRMIYFCNRGELAQREFGPLPCWSTLTDDCIRRGRDITDGGAVYNYHSICFLGAANTADSLCAVKRLVFERREISATELLAALRANFEGAEALRRRLLAGAPKYGNDAPEVDGIARAAAEHFIRFMDKFRSPLGGRYFTHLFSFLCNIDFGKTTGATPDGRRAGEPLAYSLSAHQGRDEKGITAMLKSLARLPHDMAAGSSAAIVEIDPKLFEGTQGARRMTGILQALLAMRVGQIQFNVVTAERLERAQREPERYGNLAVRVAGFSQMFKLIPRDLQDHIIARTKHER